LCRHRRLNPTFPPFTKGGIPLFGKEGLGEILKEYVCSIMDSLVNDIDSSLMDKGLARKLNVPRSEFPAKNLDMEILFPLHYATKT
jgi:hypothetical protein